MKRRLFLRKTSLSALILPAVITSVGLSSKKTNIIASHSPDLKSGSGISEKHLNENFVLNELSIDALQNLMKTGEFSSRSITELYLQRIQLYDKAGPKLNSIIELNPDALSIADQLDKERAAGKLRGPMHGIPVLIKDNINTGDKMMTTAGSLALVGNHAQADAFIVVQLRKAGAVILGKTNLSEWANYRSTRSASGWSSRGLQTKNPYVLSRTPSGSSAGSGSATAANLCAISIGTETDGSIVSPSSVNGLVGIKPTVGLLSRSGIIPISKTQDTAGPMAKTVKDAAILLGVLAVADPADAITLESKGKSIADYHTALSTDGLKGKRLGIEKSLLNGHEGIDRLTQQALKVLRDQGAIIVEVELLKLTSPLGKYEGTVLSFEFKEGLNAYLSNASAPVKSLAETIAFNKNHESTVMPYFKQETFLEAEARSDLKSKDYLNAHTELLNGSRKAIDSLLTSLKLDAICAPTNGIAGCIDEINGDYDTGYSFSSPAAVSGYPHITVPMGRVHECPVGFSFIGTAYSEASLLQLAYAYEQASKHRVSPKFLGAANPA